MTEAFEAKIGLKKLQTHGGSVVAGTDVDGCGVVVIMLVDNFVVNSSVVLTISVVLVELMSACVVA